MNELHEQSDIVTEKTIIKISSFARYVLLIVAILTLANISIEFDIPIYRQVMGVLLLLLPGLLFMRILNPIIEDTIEKLVLTFGICISILILIGLTLNYISLSIGLYRPMSSESLMIMLDSICILFILVMSKKNVPVIKFSFPKNRLNSYDKLFLSIAILVPTWSFWGVHVMNKYSYNTLLLGLFIFVSIVIILVSVYHNKIASSIYPIIIFSISISFVLLYPMRSEHLLGMDVHSEYYLFQEVINNLNWQVIPIDKLSSSFQLLRPCISISLLPALFQSILQLDPETLYRLYIPILFSITPLCIYVISQHYLTNHEAFLASIAFISYNSFFEVSYYSRAILALFFFALFILVLFNDSCSRSHKSILLLLLSMSMIFTHYSSTFVLLFIFATSVIILYILSKKINFKRELTITLVTIIFISAFFWYGMVTDGILNISIWFVKTVLNIDNFYAENAHNELVYQLGGNISRNYISGLNLINSWLFILLIGVGALNLILRPRQYWLESKEKNKCVLLKKEFEPEFVIITVICIFILASTLILPYLSTSYDLTRIYFQTSVVLSVVFIIGGKSTAIVIKRISNVLKITNVSKNRNNHINIKTLESIIILAVLIPHLLFVANVPQELSGYGDSIIFNSAGTRYDWYYIHDSDVSCVKWFNSNQMENHNLLADYFGAFQIRDQGHIEDYRINEKLEKTPETEYIFLRETNIAKNKIYYNFITTETTGNFTFNEYPLDKLYSSPAAILYRSNING